MKKIKYVFLCLFIFSFTLFLFSCDNKNENETESIQPSISIQENITLNVGENFDWNDYVTIKVNGITAKVENTMITIIEGNPETDGVVTYKITFAYEGKEYTKNFSVTWVTSKEPDSPVVSLPTDYIPLGRFQEYEKDTACKAYGYIAGKNTVGFLLKDLEEESYIYVFTATDLAIGQKVSVSGKIDVFGGVKQISSASITKLDEIKEITYSPIEYTASKLNAYTSNPTVGAAVKITGDLTISGKYYNLKVDGTSTIVSICYPSQNLSSYDGKTIEIEGYLLYLSGSSTKYANILLMKNPIVKESSTPSTDETRVLTSDEKSLFTTAINKDYSNVTIIDMTFGYNAFYYADGLIYVEYDEDEETYYYYLRKTNSGYDYLDEDDTWTVLPDEEVPYNLLELNFKAIDVNKLKINPATELYVIQSNDISIHSFCPWWVDDYLDIAQIQFNVSEDGYIDFIYIVDTSGEYSYCYMEDFGTTVVELESSSNQEEKPTNTITEEQKKLWNQAVNQEYTSYTISSTDGITTEIDGDLYHVIGFDEDGYTFLSYYKYVNNSLYTYGYTGWVKSKDDNPTSFNFNALKSVSVNNITYDTETESYCIPTTNLNTFASNWNGNSTSIYFQIMQEGETFYISKIGYFGTDTFVSVYNVGKTEIINPEESCNYVDILNIQDLVVDQVCTTEGTVVFHTKKGFLVADDMVSDGFVYVSLDTAPTIAVGNRVKIFGVATLSGDMLQFEKNTATITDLGKSSYNHEFNKEYVNVSDLLDYLEEPIFGLQVEFVATYTKTNTLKVDYLDYPISCIETNTDYSSFLNKQVLVQGYLFDCVEKTENNFIYYIIVVSMKEESKKNPYLEVLTSEQKTEFTAALNNNYANVTIYEDLFGTTSYITTQQIKVEYENDYGKTESYLLKQTSSGYSMNEGSGFESISKEEYYSYAMLFDFSKINIENVTYNPLTGLYEITEKDLNIDTFLPYFVADEIEVIQYSFFISDGYITSVLISLTYEGEYCDVVCVLSNFGNTQA